MRATKDVLVLSFFTSLCTEELNGYKKNRSRSTTLRDEFNLTGKTGVRKTHQINS